MLAMIDLFPLKKNAKASVRCSSNQYHKGKTLVLASGKPVADSCCDATNSTSEIRMVIKVFILL
jgi:hypothetical protein